MTTDARRTLDAATTEKEFQASVVKLARLCGWRVHFTHDSRHSPDGFPDLLMCHPRSGWIIAAELKTERGRVTGAQQEWLLVLQRCGAAAWVWRPHDWPEIEMVLKGGGQ